MNLPAHYSSLMPYSVVSSADDFIKFLTEVFGAKEIYITRDETGTVRHAEYSINGSTMMFGQGNDMWKPMPTSVFAVLEDVDGTHSRAVNAGSESLQEPGDQNYGRASGFKDPFGNIWWLNRPAGDHTK